MRRRSIQVDDIAMSWLEHGEGRPVVFIHGVPTSPELWKEVMLRLWGVRALAWEMVGYGSSMDEGRGRDLSVARQADYLRAWLDQLGIERPILVGHDLGGGVAQIAAVREPERYSGLLLTNSIGYDNWPVPSVMVLRASGRLLRRLPQPLFKALLLTFYVRGHSSLAKARTAYRRHAPHYLRSGGAAALQRQIRWLDASDTRQVADRLKALPLPAMIVWGAADVFLKIDYGRRFANDLRAPLREIRGGRHFIPEDQPNILADELQRFADADRQDSYTASSTSKGHAAIPKIKQRRGTRRASVRAPAAILFVTALAGVAYASWRSRSQG